ncbi:MAG: SMC-Scp complex subunit ScpB [bacterium]
MIEEGKIKNIIECILFVNVSPVTLKKIKEILEYEDTALVKSKIKELSDDYNARDCGLEIKEVAGGYQLSTRAEYSQWIKKLERVPQPTKLSQKALETLSIIAYKQPITRAEIEKIRGVDTSGVIYNLLDKKLVRVTGRKECLGHPIQYGTTNEFLRHFGLNSISEIPLLEEIKE